MTTPPPGQWPPPPPSGPPGPPSWGPPQPWGQEVPGGGNRSKWILGALALLVVVVVTVVATLLFTRNGSGEGPPLASSPPSTSVDTSDIASADDRGPVGIILEDPTCQSWTPIAAAFAHASANGWDTRDPAIPATQWTPEQKNRYEAVGAALRDGADRTVDLARKTPHRVMRELYEQFIAYSRAYVEQIPDYIAASDHLVRVSIGISTTLNAVCDSITYGAAGARSPLVARAAPPADSTPIGRPENAERFLVAPSSTCAQWLSAAKQFSDDTAAWRSIDPNTPASGLDPAQRAINAQVMSVMNTFADDTQRLGRRSDNSVWADLATLSAQYRRAYSGALLTYAPADNDLQIAASNLTGAISEACRAVGA